jgi:ATP/maltotriose-dependent transcriptional regulator MalT
MTMMVTEDRDVLGAATGVIDLQRDHGFGRRQEPAVQVLDIDRSRGPAATLERRRERLGQEKRAGRETALDREVVSSLVSDRRGACSVAVDAIDALTVRERETLELIAQGRSNAGIARELVVTLGAVEKHISSIFAKLHLPATDDDHRRVLAVLEFLRATGG